MSTASELIPFTPGDSEYFPGQDKNPDTSALFVNKDASLIALVDGIYVRIERVEHALVAMSAVAQRGDRNVGSALFGFSSQLDEALQLLRVLAEKREANHG